ncbi:MAG: excinuclease ABC subunit UvrA [Nitrospirae bacterium]|nr:excinuclease ABC subunit UvrA [Nitrospirota bacterium]
MLNKIVIKGARVHNLKNIHVEIPRDSLTVITGPSGSGKSSLAFDTLYAEGQRRYVESLSAYARQFLDQLQKPDVDSIEGLSPAIAIEQKTTAKSLRSTVGTITEIYDYLRVAYTRIGKLSCYQCGHPIAAQGAQQIIELITALPEGARIQVLSPIVMGRKGEYKKELHEARKKGFIRARIDGEMTDITKEVKLNKHKRHNIDIVIDRLLIRAGIDKHISKAVALATGLTDVVIINILDEGKDLFFSTKLACSGCGINYPEISPRFFSFNSPYGACPKCRGLGFKNLSEEEYISGLAECPSCNGLRLRKEALSVRINNLNIGELSAKPIKDVITFMDKLKLTKTEQIIASKILKETRERLHFLEKVGLGYLTLHRPAATLSSGEAQRIKLATQIGSSLTGVLYIFDEPSIGLHPRDHSRLLDSLQRLKEMGNTVVVVEHDEETMMTANHIIDMGPGAGLHGGSVAAEGSLREIMSNPDSVTGRFLSGQLTIPAPEKRRKPKDYVTIKGAQEFNLKKIDVDIPLGVFTCVTGVSGSGKSTLILEILYKSLAKKLYSSVERPGKHESILGIEKIDKVIDIDQSPLGRTPRSNPATYTGIFTFVRELFSQVPDARVRGYRPGRFSFNVTGGRCEACKGDGLVKVSMHFLPDLYVPCDTCKGDRYNKETLEIRYKGKNISDVLSLTVSQALEFFESVPPLRNKLTTLERVGLGYIQLGQSATTLSGGEAQRVKLSRELSKKATGRTLYILDEPTTGLHFVDIQKLLEVLNRLVAAGNSVIVIEHNLDIIKSADYIIDLGPEGGEEGGRLIAAGTPEEVASNPKSYTGAFLKKKLLAEAAA